MDKDSDITPGVTYTRLLGLEEPVVLDEEDAEDPPAINPWPELWTYFAVGLVSLIGHLWLPAEWMGWVVLPFLVIGFLWLVYRLAIFILIAIGVSMLGE